MHLTRAILVPTLALFSACGTGEDGTAAGTAAFDWSLDIDFSGEASLEAVRDTASVTANVTDAISGRVNGYDTALAEDTLRFLNQEYDQFLVNAPLSADGAFRFDGADLLGDLDGSMTLLISLRSRAAGRQPRPDTLILELERPCGGRPC